MMFENPQHGKTLGFDIDDGTGLRVVHARFESESKFSWSVFDGYDRVRILTYSAGVGAIVRLLDKHEFNDFECVFGYEGTLNTLKTILAFQKVACGDTRAVIKNLPDERHSFILSRVREGQAHFRVLHNEIAHAKLYLLDNTETGRTRALIGSANLSETALGGRQSETMVCFDDDPAAWEHYLGQYQSIRDKASGEIPLPPERIEEAEINLEDTPVLNATDNSTLIIDSEGSAQQLTVPVQITRVEKVKEAIPSIVSSLAPPPRKGKRRITPEVKRKIAKEISRVRSVQSDKDVDHKEMSISRDTNAVSLFGKPFSLEADLDGARRDARLLVDFFNNYEGTFEGGMGVERLQRDYFILWSFLYFSPFMCDMRTLANHEGDVFQFPATAIVYGKPSCGKSSLIDTLMTSMFGRAHNVHRDSFTKQPLRALQWSNKRFPVVIDDLGKNALANYGEHIIKGESELLPDEYPCFLLSMNKDAKTFPDETIKRSLMIYTSTALASYKEPLRHELHLRVRDLRRELTTNLYRMYLQRVLDRNETSSLNDWLELSSSVLSELIGELLDDRPPKWCASVTWSDYADKRYENVKFGLLNLLRPAKWMKREGEQSEGWMLEDDRVITVEKTDTFGRRPFDWQNVPSTLIDENASVGGRTVLYRPALEEFLGMRIGPRHNGLLGTLLTKMGMS